MRAIVLTLLIYITFILISHVSSTCNYGQFPCNDGGCTRASYQCDGGNDCDDNSDELNCMCTTGPACYYKPISSCESNEFRCTSGACIPSYWECDGDFDCADLSDEHSNCDKPTCEPYQFTCDNGGCIDARLKCNAKNDCGDNSDETVCQINPATWASNASLTDCGDAFRCKDGTCIPQANLCDLLIHCPDGSDEGGQCQTEPCLGNLCDHACRVTPSGCQCACLSGYRLAGDGLTCVDMLECSMDPPVCSQLCTEAVGSYSCGCFKEFTMRYDNVTCKSRGNPMSVFFAVGNEIRQYTPARRNLRVVQMEAAGQLSALEADIAVGTLYYGVRNDNRLYQLLTANSSRKTMGNVGEASHISIDWITQNVYVVSSIPSDSPIPPSSSNEVILVIDDDEELIIPQPAQFVGNAGPAGRLQVCNFEARRCATLSGLQNRITALAVDSLAKFLFFADIDSYAVDANALSTVRLVRSGLDGQNAQVISTFNKTITDMTIDYRHKHVYIAREASIDRLDYDGGHLVNIVASSLRIQGLNLFEDQLYFLTEEGLTMHKCLLYGGTRRCTNFKLSADATNMFVIVQNTRQTPGRNACVNYNCSHLCVPNASGASCLCENGNVVDEHSDCRE